MIYNIILTVRIGCYVHMTKLPVWLVRGSRYFQHLKFLPITWRFTPIRTELLAIITSSFQQSTRSPNTLPGVRLLHSQWCYIQIITTSKLAAYYSDVNITNLTSKLLHSKLSVVRYNAIITSFKSGTRIWCVICQRCFISRY